MFGRRAAAVLVGACSLVSAACALHPDSLSRQLPISERGVAAGPPAPFVPAAAWSGREADSSAFRRARFDPELDWMVGESPTGVMRLLGEPTLVWRNPPAEVWQYAGTGCVLHVFLYQDPGDRRYRVSYVEIVNSDRHLLSDDCVGQLLDRATARLG